MHRRLRQGHVAAELALVEQLALAQTGGPHDPAEVGQGRDGGERLQVALQVGAHVAVEPDRPFPVRLQMQRRRGEAAAPRQGPPVLRLSGLGGHQLGPVLVASLEQLLPEAAAPQSLLLPPGHGPERQVAGPPGEGLGDLAHEKQVGRPREQEPPRPALSIDGPFHRAQQVRLPLHLVDGHRLAAPQKRFGVAAGLVQWIEIVQRDEAASSRSQLLRQGALPRLPGPRDHNGRHDSESFLQAGQDQSWLRD